MCTGRTCTQQFLDREWTWAATYSSIRSSAGQHRCKKSAIWQNKQCSRDSLFKENSIWEALASQQRVKLSYCNCRPTERSGCCPHLTHLLHTSKCNLRRPPSMLLTLTVQRVFACGQRSRICKPWGKVHKTSSAESSQFIVLQLPSLYLPISYCTKGRKKSTLWGHLDVKKCFRIFSCSAASTTQRRSR